MITFDKSPDYMRSALKMSQIKNLLPTAKIIMILRNPTARAYSGLIFSLFLLLYLCNIFCCFIGFHHNCRHERFSRVNHQFDHRGTTYPIKSVIRTDEEYNKNEDRSSSDGDFNEKNNLLV